MDFEIMQAMKALPDNKQATFAMMYASRERSSTIALLLCFFLGGVGGHHYYLGRTALGVLSTLFFWTFIPGIISILELFFVSGVVRDLNRRAANEILATIQ
jgi:TM2 domain-containing membrane protein YozV